MDESILEPLVFSKKGIQSLHSELIKLVKLREERAKSVKKQK